MNSTYFKLKGKSTLNIEIPSTKELEFILFCIDFVAKAVNQPSESIYQKLKESGLLQDYLIENYEVLHTLGKDYLVTDIIQIMQERKLL